MNNFLPRELQVELSDIDWETLNKQMQLTYINWCLERLKVNYILCDKEDDHFTLRNYIKRQVDEIKGIRNYIKMTMEVKK